MRAWPLALLLVLTLLAGCIGGADDDADDTLSGRLVFQPDWADLALLIEEDHDHTDPAQHTNLTTPNFEIVGWDPLTSPTFGNTPAGYVCGDTLETDDGRRLAAVESRTQIGFTIADVTNASSPEWLGELVMPHTYVYDLAVVPDGKHVTLVTSQAKTPEAPVLSVDDKGRLVREDLIWRSPCAPEGVPVRWAATEDPVPRPVSILLVDISDPSDPVVVDHRPLPGYGHSAFSTKIDGRYWILASTVASPKTQSFQFYEVIDTPLGGRLNHLSTYNSPLQDARGGPTSIGGHTDGWIEVHPVTGKTTAYLVGGWDFITLDLSDPLMPQELGYWTDVVPGREGPVGALHSVFPARDLKDGRHYTVIGPEYHNHPEGQPSGNIWVLDTTDPASVKEVAAWTLPYEVEWSGTYMFSPHYLTVWNETIFVSMYHGGVWALDMSGVTSEDFTLLPSIGVFMPTNIPEEGVTGTFRWAPNLQEVLSYEDGTLVTFDSMSGIYTFRFDPGQPAPAPEPWPVKPVSW